ncbi:MAG: DUF2332 domain-containing protein [Actinobacteria bacterium]|nr:DUF2332 domain-containing protein [Actinomycetota bacterium]
MSAAMAEDEAMLRVLGRIEHTPQPNLLFAGVQYLMTKQGDGPLQRHYPNFGGQPGSDVESAFREFVLTHEEELVAIGATRHTQTNECRRCVALLPAVWETGLDRFHLVDVGTSAGLNLLLDRYRYRWDGVAWGPTGSPVLLETESRGRPPAPRPITVLSRTGIDLHPVDATDPDARLWLESLIWPEHHDRRHRLRAALTQAADADIRLVCGDAVATLSRVIDDLPSGEPVLVMHSFALNQFSPAARAALDAVIEDCRRSRPVHRVSLELAEGADASAMLSIDTGEGPLAVGRAQAHGEWVELYARP